MDTYTVTNRREIATGVHEVVLAPQEAIDAMLGVTDGIPPILLIRLQMTTLEALLFTIGAQFTPSFIAL